MYKSGLRLTWTSFFPEHVGTRKIKLLRTASGSTALKCLPAEILCRLNGQYEEKILSCASVTTSFVKAVKKSSTHHMLQCRYWKCEIIIHEHFVLGSVYLVGPKDVNFSTQEVKCVVCQTSALV